jgi:hypothetical protein
MKRIFQNSLDCQNVKIDKGGGYVMLVITYSHLRLPS